MRGNTGTFTEFVTPAEAGAYSTYAFGGLSQTLRRKKPHAFLHGVSLVTSLTITDEQARGLGNTGTFTEFVTPAKAGVHITPTTLRTLP
jgi:hypothetical protein